MTENLKSLTQIVFRSLHSIYQPPRNQKPFRKSTVSTPPQISITPERARRHSESAPSVFYLQLLSYYFRTFLTALVASWLFCHYRIKIPQARLPSEGGFTSR